MRRVTADGLALVKRFEGFSPAPYLCPAGVWTIGYGSTRDASGRPLTKDHPSITEAEAEDLLSADLDRFAGTVLRLIRVPLSDGQFDALASFAYNLGGGALQRSTLRAKVNRREHADVPAEFMKWTKGGGRVLPGLVKRRMAEAAMYAG
ncbi:MAG: lysozyme [Alphaproteobacteria bacterium]|nr:lysozyme [Alphaproteobacteria bacterium]